MLLFGKGWVYQEFDGLTPLIIYHVMGYLIWPCFALIPALLLHKMGSYFKLITWSFFGIFLARAINDIYWRIPNNDIPENELIEIIFIGLIIIHGLFKAIIMMNSKNERFISGVAVGVTLGKTFFSKTWIGKFLAAIYKIFVI